MAIVSTSVTPDIDECASNPCQNGGTCSDGVNSFSCNCVVGFLGDTCAYADPCLNNPCKNNGTCYVDVKNNYTFFCVCPIPKAFTGQDCGTPLQCFKDIMYPYGKENGDHEITQEDIKARQCPRVSIKNGLYFFDDQFYEIFICSNGILLFDSNVELRRPISNLIPSKGFRYRIPMLFPYWSTIDRKKSFCSSAGSCFFDYVNRSSVLYQNYTAASETQEAVDVLKNASEQVKSRQPEAFSAFSAKWVLVVTWLRLRPKEKSPKEGITNTFQAVVITNGTYTFLKYHYPCGALQWSAPAIYEGSLRNTYDEYPVAGFNGRGTDYDATRSPGLDGSGSYEVKNLDDKNGNAGRRGEYFFRIEERTGDDAKAKCNAWFEFQEMQLKDNLESADEEIIPCPCTRQQVELETRFNLINVDDSEYYESVQERAINKMISSNESIVAVVRRRCSYKVLTGSIETKDSFLEVTYTQRPSNVVDDKSARTLCLKQSNGFDKFRRVRLPNDCARYNEFVINRILSHGDPHFKTLDGGNYTFNGVGEYTIITADNGTFVLQARTQLAPGGLDTATIFSAGAAKEVDTSKVEVKLNSEGGLEMYVNGSLYNDLNTLNNVSRIIGENLRASKKSAYCVQVVFKTGTGVEFCESKEMIHFVVSLSQDYFNKTKGLFGTYNRDLSDDFTLPNGTVLSPSISSRQIHYDFGLKWQITDQESLFTYGPNENVSTFVNASFEPMFVDEIVWADNETQAAAEAQCGGDVVCLFDAASTNDVTIGLNSQEVNVMVEEENKRLNNFPPKFIDVPSCINVTLGEVFFLTVTAFDNDSAITFSVLDRPIGANFTSTGNQLNFTWNVTSIDRVKFTFVATDDLDASASYTPCIKLCPCQNGGQCVEPKVGDKLNNDSNFIYQGCSCSAGYTGRFCESDLNACNLNGDPCFTGVTCEDQPAPANITGFTCGPCPVGYSGNGIDCVDIDECGTISLSNCSQKCTNTPGSFVCSCNPGFKLNSVERSCDDIDECIPTNADCMHRCNNTIGNYTCECNEFFEVDPSNDKNCIPSNRCSNNTCDQVCFRKSDGTEACDCNAGYQLAIDGETCEDIDECKLSGIKCTHTCENKVPGFQCTCFPGYSLEADGYTCSDIDECLDPSLFNCTGSFRVCENTPGSSTCRCQDGLFFINGSCTALGRDETPPPPIVRTPKSASEEEINNSVELRLVGITEEQYNATVDENLRSTMARQMDNFCDANREGCGISAKRRRRALNIFTADNVHLLPGFPVQDSSSLRVAFYILLPSLVIPGGGVIPVDTLLQVVNISKSDLEAALGVTIAEIKKAPTHSPPPSQASNVTSKSSPASTSTTQTSIITTIGPETTDDWKIIVGVVVGVLVIVIIGIIVVCVIKKKNRGKVDVLRANQRNGRDSPGSDVSVHRQDDNHEMRTYHGASPNQPLV